MDNNSETYTTWFQLQKPFAVMDEATKTTFISLSVCVIGRTAVVSKLTLNMGVVFMSAIHEMLLFWNITLAVFLSYKGV